MSYINQFKLIQEILKGKQPDAKELLGGVDRKAIVSALRRTKAGLPKPFICTEEPIEEANFAKIPHVDKEKLWDIYEKIQRSPEESERELPKLIKLSKKYPDVPAIYNYIGTIYAISKQTDKYFSTIIETTRRFPDYLFGKTAVAEYYINNDELTKAAKALDGKFEIYMHYPSTVKVFHVSEVRAFYSVMGIYYARSNRIARALFCYFILDGVAPEHFATQRLGNEIIWKEIEKLGRKMSKTR